MTKSASEICRFPGRDSKPGHTKQNEGRYDTKAYSSFQISAVLPPPHNSVIVRYN